MAGREYRFEIDAYTPETIPMGRLAEYMHDFATLFGQRDNVHFKGLETGSTKIVSIVEQEAIPKVQERILKARRGEGPREPRDAIRNINRKLKEDNAVGAVIEMTPENARAEIIRFPGRELDHAVTFSAFNQAGSIDGEVVVVGGTSDPVPVHIQSRDTGLVRICEASRSVAKALGHYLFGAEVRVSGNGRWLRDEQGQWQLERFRINAFEVLKEESLTAVVADLRSVPGTQWDSLKDPWAELDSIRNGPHDRK